MLLICDNVPGLALLNWVLVIGGWVSTFKLDFCVPVHFLARVQNFAPPCPSVLQSVALCTSVVALALAPPPPIANFTAEKKS